jgi:hypothetical protein
MFKDVFKINDYYNLTLIKYLHIINFTNLFMIYKLVYI